MRIASKSLEYGLALCAALALSGCGNLGYEDNDEPTPRAVATTLGQPFTTDANGVMQTTVRSGAEVVLSAKDSTKGDDDTGLPLVKFDWQQASPGANAVNLIYRTSNTVSFTAPQVTQDTTLQFRLVVSDARGNSAATDARVLVKPVRDADRFLQFLRADNSFAAVLTTQSAIAGNAGALPDDVLPAQVTLTKLVSFTDRDGIPHVRVPVGRSTARGVVWSARIGTNTNCAANENPTLRLPIPRIDLDDALATTISGFPDATLLSDILEAADIDAVTLEVRVDVTSGNMSVTASNPRVCINGATTSVPSGTVVASESLYGNNLPRDSKVAAQAYYATLDPTGAKATMNGWLNANGFNSAAVNWNADAHAVYTNNYDLGFGRDMYMKFGACDAGAAALPLAQRAGRCDVSAIVVNYADVEAAAKKLNAIIAVAMEYNASPGGGARFVKFYTFAPDRRTGVFKRVLSVNLDRRGEQYMPQACVVCHGGTPGTAASYATNTDINATFLPWDLDSLLYADTDPGFSSKPRNAALKAQLTRAAQASQLKRLNEGAYLTYDLNHPVAGRYALARELVEKWYGGAGLPNANYDDSGTPSSWAPGGANSNPTDSNLLYHNLFARNCRACHVMQVPAAGDPRTATLQPQGVPQPLQACGNDSRLANTSVGAPSQVPMGCYWQFAHAPNLAQHLSGAQMPFARRTMDRMWIDLLSAQQTFGQNVQAHLQATQNMTVTTPGTPVACIEPFGSPISGQSASAVTRNAWTSLASSCSRFMTGKAWTLAAPNGSVAALVGSNTDAPRFLPDRQGDYTVTLTDTMTGSVTTNAVARVVVAAPLAQPGSVPIPIVGGSGSRLVNAVSDLGSTSRDAIASINVVSADAGLTVSASGSNSLNITTNSLSIRSLVYTLTDVDGDVSNPATIAVTGTASLALTVNPRIVSVAPNSSGNSINLATGVSNPSGLSLTYALTSSPSQQRSVTFSANWYPTTPPAVVGATATLSAGSASLNTSTGAASYTAPARFISEFGGSQIGPRDTFDYRVCFAGQPVNSTNCVFGTVELRIAGTQAFSDVRTALNSTCSLCHASAQTGANLLMSSGFSAKESYCRFRGLSATGSTGTEAANTRYLDLTSSANSLLHRKPRGLDGHGGGTPLSCNAPGDGGCATLDAIANWIDEGAYFTEGSSSNQSCP